MKKILPFVFAILLLLTACGKKPLFGVSTNEDNSISVTAENGLKDSMGIGYLTVGENEEVVVDAAFDKGGKIGLRFTAAVLGPDDDPGSLISGDFLENPDYESAVSDADSMRFGAEPGEYTVSVTALSRVNGSARIYTEPVDDMSALGYTPDSLVGIGEEKSGGRGHIEITKASVSQYDVQINWSSSATEMFVWTMTARPAGSNALRYEDCRLSIITFDEEGNDTEALQYENGTGEFTLLSTAELMWQDDVGHVGDDTVFVSVG